MSSNYVKKHFRKNMKKDITQMRFFAAELRRELDNAAVEGCYCEVEAFADGTEQPKIKVKSSAANLDQTTLYCLDEVVEYCQANELHHYVTVETLLSGSAIPVIIIF